MPKDGSWEVIVVDNASADKTREIVNEYEGVKLIKNRENFGFAAGNNIGLKEAKGDYVLLLNQDVEQIDGAIEKMLDFLKNNEDFGLAAPQLLYPDGRVQLSCRPFYKWSNLFLDYITFSQYRKNYYDHTKSQEADQPMASVLMIKREVLNEVKGFDDHRDFWLYFNDMDLSYRIHQAGHKHYLLTEAKFYHHHGESAFKMLQYKRLLEYHRGLKRFFFKHHIKHKFGPAGLVFWVFLAASYVSRNIEVIIKGFWKKMR